MYSVVLPWIVRVTFWYTVLVIPAFGSWAMAQPALGVGFRSIPSGAAASRALASVFDPASESIDASTCAPPGPADAPPAPPALAPAGPVPAAPTPTAPLPAAP